MASRKKPSCFYIMSNPFGNNNIILSVPHSPRNHIRETYQYHWMVLLIPLRLSYFRASVSVAALHRNVKL